MRIADFLETAREQILEEAMAFARGIPALEQTDEEVLRDHLPAVLETISTDLRREQSRTASIEKSHGNGPVHASQTSAHTHGLMRAKDGINVEQLVAEFRALRSSILRLWSEAHPLEPKAVDDIIRFNEAIDQAVAESVQYHAIERERWRQIFLGILGHDLRSPLHAVALTVEMMRNKQLAPPQHIALLARGVGRMTSLLDSLLEYNRANLGPGMVLQRAPVDLERVCADELELQRAAHPDTRMELQHEGMTDGVFDESRVREAVANLVSNAVKHGQSAKPIVVRVAGSTASVSISVTNTGALPYHEIEQLFEPLRRRDAPQASEARTHLGLGLFIVRQIARAHNGEVTGSSSDNLVCFTLELPRSV